MLTRFFLAGSAALLLSGCALNPFGTSQAMTSPAGASAVAATPAINDPRVAVLTGAGVTALNGTAVSSYMDLQEVELRADLLNSGVTITRAGGHIALNLPANLTFDADKAVVKPGFNATVTAIGAVLKKYDKTMIDVYGYTDSQGPAEANKDLSQRRAVGVATVLANQGVDQRRFFIQGRGASDPIASNATEVGRAQNRRVEIQISPLT
jgi:outer membrane protein OmpA-like peptidoglycan-associated protein